MIMKEMLKAYAQREPEIVFEWNDAETDAKGWVVINSLRGGAAGGGTRMHPRLDRREVVSLAKTMEIKFTVSGPQIGGAKSGIAQVVSCGNTIATALLWHRRGYECGRNPRGHTDH